MVHKQVNDPIYKTCKKTHWLINSIMFYCNKITHLQVMNELHSLKMFIDLSMKPSYHSQMYFWTFNILQKTEIVSCQYNNWPWPYQIILQVYITMTICMSTPYISRNLTFIKKFISAWAGVSLLKHKDIVQLSLLK